MRISAAITSFHLIASTAAFTLHQISYPQKNISSKSSRTQKSISNVSVSYLTMAANDDMNSNVAELTSALARIDKQWDKRESTRPSQMQGWTKLILEQDQEDTSSASTNNGQSEFVYLLEPESTPSMIIMFLGGAGLGQFPHIAYNSLLTLLSRKLNAAIVTAPYPLSLDHFSLSKTAGESLRKAIVQCEENGNYSSNLPKFYLGHSLGSKLLAIALAASGVRDVQGVGFMSYNNFGFKDTLSMVKGFADDLNGENSGGFGGMGMSGINLDQILDFAGEAVNMLGFEFTPDPATMDRIIEMKYNDALQQKTRLFTFDDDDLDSSPSFVDACSKGSSTHSLSISKSQGNHLAPVFLKFGLDDLDLPEEAKPFVDDAVNGFQSASFGDETAMNEAVDEIVNWIMGKEPSRPARIAAAIEKDS